LIAGGDHSRAEGQMQLVLDSDPIAGGDQPIEGGRPAGCWTTIRSLVAIK
jgi:hypothetical protein